MPAKLNQLSHKKKTIVRAKLIIQLSDTNLFDLFFQEWQNVLEDD